MEENKEEVKKESLLVQTVQATVFTLTAIGGLIFGAKIGSKVKKIFKK